MVLVSILKRKDASSVVTAIVIGMAAWIFVSSFGAPISSWLLGQNTNTHGFKDAFITPIVVLLVQLIIFELVTRLYVAVAPASKKK